MPPAILKELLLLWITLTTRFDSAVNPSTVANSDVILDSIKADFNAVAGGAWNWDNITRPLAKAIADAVISNNAAHLNVAMEFQHDLSIQVLDGTGKPIPPSPLATTGGWDPTQHDHPTVAELKAVLGL
jgi:hypothetical protein